MTNARSISLCKLLGCALLTLSAHATLDAQPNPYVEVPNWLEQPEGRAMGAVSSVYTDADGNLWLAERCGQNSCVDRDDYSPIHVYEPSGRWVRSLGKGLLAWPHGIYVDADGNVWVTDFVGNEEGTKGHQVHKFSPDGELLMSLGTAGQPGSGPNQFNQPNDVVTAPDGSIFVADGHSGQGMTTNDAIEQGRAAGATARIIKFSPDGRRIKEWGRLGVRHGEFRTPHALAFDSKGRLWVADRGNHRLELFDQDGNYLESRYAYGRISGIFITADDVVYAIDSESGPLNHPGWRNGVRIGPLDEDRITGFIPPFERESRVYQGTAGEGVAVDADGNVYAAEGPNSLEQAGGAFTKYGVE